MNKWRTIALALALVPALALAQQSERAPESKAHVLSRAEFDALLAKPEQLLIVDVRRPDELTSIGGFQVLQHRLVEDVLALEEARGLLARAAAVEVAGGRAEFLAAMAKLSASRQKNRYSSDGPGPKCAGRLLAHDRPIEGHANGQPKNPRTQGSISTAVPISESTVPGRVERCDRP